ncbi:secreted RxLR effector protein 78-like [Juglans regia]|uniref:Secreted RxLR effector protein 78-like n=1 Tax=Juglans regia TaxID=51240 RepID=A0A6P9EFN9_JUGRE|nr:secreted RxLR effector protein 78-like [Juglans regia]
MAKVLANMLKLILPTIISSTQSAYVPGRLIADNVILAFEALHSMQSKMKGSKGYMSLKLDMSKAYDRLEWSFIELVMERMSFNRKWIDIILNCVKTISYSLLINGIPQPGFTPSRGIRQGDPESPYLFIICSKALTQILNKAEEAKLITGLPMARGKLHTSHL